MIAQIKVSLRMVTLEAMDLPCVIFFDIFLRIFLCLYSFTDLLPSYSTANRDNDDACK